MPHTSRVALITGCGKPIGIGNSTARALAAKGVAVVVSDLRPTGVANEHNAPGDLDQNWGGVDSLVEEITKAGGTAYYKDLRPLLSGGGVDHPGRRWRARLAPAPARARADAPVPLHLAAVGPRTLRLAGALADTALLNYASGPEYVAWAVALVREGAERAGRDPAAVDVAGYVLLARTDQEDSARQLQAARRTVGAVHAIPGEGELLAAPSGGSPAALTDAALARFAAVGDGDACRARLDEYRAAGLRSIVLLPRAMRALHGGDGRGEATR